MRLLYTLEHRNEIYRFLGVSSYMYRKEERYARELDHQLGSTKVVQVQEAGFAVEEEVDAMAQFLQQAQGKPVRVSKTKDGQPEPELTTSSHEKSADGLENTLDEGDRVWR